MTPFWNALSNAPASGGKIYAFTTNTTTPRATYSDAALTTPNTHPIVLGADGRASVDIFLDPTYTYSMVLKDSAGNVIAEDDPTAGSAVESGIEAHNDDPDAHFPGTESQAGFLELANTAEVLAGTDTERAITPAGLASCVATVDQLGVLRLANDGQTEGGTNDARATTPLGIQALHATLAEIIAAVAGDKHFIGPTEAASLITVSGSPPEISIKFAGGSEIKLGKRTQTSDADQAHTYAATFTTQTIAVLVSRIAANVATPLFPSSVSATGFHVDPDAAFSGPSDFFFIAAGN